MKISIKSEVEIEVILNKVQNNYFANVKIAGNLISAIAYDTYTYNETTKTIVFYKYNEVYGFADVRDIDRLTITYKQEDK